MTAPSLEHARFPAPSDSAARGVVPKRRRPWPWVVAVAAVLATAGAVTAWMTRPRPAHAPSPYRFETSEVSRGPIRAKVTATGTVNPIVTVSVGSQVSGTIRALGANFNSVVQPGQMIAQIDPRPFKAAVEQAEANLLAARANVHKAAAQAVEADRQARRMSALLQQKLIAQQDFDTAQTNADVARASSEAAVASQAQAMAALDSARLSLSFTTITAPIHGTVITRNVDVGQTVAASFAAPTLFLIGEDLAKMEVDTNIAEADVGRLAPGLPATFTVDAFPAEVFKGTIREIRNSPQIIQNVVTYNAVVDVENAKLQLKPGMTANLEVVYADRDDALRIENAAMRFRPPPELASQAGPAPQGQKIVWVLREDVPVPVTVTAGVSDGTSTEIVDGDLKRGERVIIEAIPLRPSGNVGRVL